MKPNFFQINSDYLSFALESTLDTSVRVPAGILVDGGWNWGTTLSIPAIVGAIDSVQLTFNGETIAGGAFYINPSNIAAEVDVFRQSAGVIKINIAFYGMLPGNTSGQWSEFDLGVHIDSFRPPNLT